MCAAMPTIQHSTVCLEEEWLESEGAEEVKSTSSNTIVRKSNISQKRRSKMLLPMMILASSMNNTKDIDYNEHEPVVIKTEVTTQAWQELYGEVETVQEALESNDPTEIVEKKGELSAESKKLTKEELEALDEDVDWKHAKQQWKVDNPDDSIKSYKDWYLSGKINSLPWEKYLPKKKRPYLMKENGQQKKGTAVE